MWSKARSKTTTIENHVKPQPELDRAPSPIAEIKNRNRKAITFQFAPPLPLVA